MNESPYEPEELNDEFFDSLLPGESGKRGKSGKERSRDARQVRLNFDSASTQYANFWSITGRQGEVYLSFGQAFPPVKELKVETRVVMSLHNVEQLHDALGKLLKKMSGPPPGREDRK